MTGWRRSGPGAAAAAVAAGAGWWVAGGPGAALAGSAVLATMLVIGFGNVRPAIVIPVVLGAATGGLIGYGVVRIFCHPDRCPAAEVAGAVGTAVLTAAGMTTVAILAVRSFDEHRRARSAGVPPPGAGCERGDDAG